MEPQIYQKNVLFTWNSVHSHELQFANAAMGLAEFGEIITASADSHDELGDFCYYLAMICNLHDWSLSEFVEKYEEELFDIVDLMNCIFDIQNIAKKVAFHGKVYTDEMKENVRQNLSHLVNYTIWVTEDMDIDIGLVYHHNIVKLQKRHNRKDGEYSFIQNTN